MCLEVQYKWKDERILNKIVIFNGADFGEYLLAANVVATGKDSGFLKGEASVNKSNLIAPGFREHRKEKS